MTSLPADLVAVPEPSCAMDETAIKQMAMMFDRIAIPPLSFMNNNAYESAEIKNTRAWLVETGILFEQDTKKVMSSSGETYEKTRELMVEDSDILLKPLGTSVEESMAARGDKEKIAELRKRTRQVTPESMFNSVDPEKYLERVLRMVTNTTRLLAIQLRSVENLEAYAVISGELSALDQDDDRLTRHDVLNIALGLPAPDKSVQWEQIIEYRNDAEARNQFPILKTCLSDTARGSVTPAQVEETLEYLLNRYHQQMERHKIHTDVKRMELFIVTTADIGAQFEDFRRSPAAQSLFAIEHRKVGLLEGESTTPGSEVAYLMEARSLFSEP